MKQFKRTLALMLSLALMCSCTPAIAEGEIEGASQDLILEIFQEEAPAAQSSEESTGNEPAAESSDADLPVIMASQDPSSAPTAAPTAAPDAESGDASDGETGDEPSAEPSADPTQEPTAEPTAQPQTSADQLPAFAQGYAVLAAQSFAYDSAAPDAQRIYFLESGTVYAADRKSASDCDRILVCFDGGEGEITAWVDACDLYPLSDEAAAAFIAGCSAACFHNDDPALPLCAIAYSQAITVPSQPDNEPQLPAMLVQQSEISLGLLESRSLQVSFSDGENYALTFTSDNPAIAAVDANGVITGRYYGATTIRITSELGNEASVQVSVLLPPTAVRFTAPRYQLGVGEDVQLSSVLSANSASALSYISGNEAVATVDANGRIHGVAPGMVYIAVQTYNRRSYYQLFTVYPAPQSIAWPQDTITMGVGEARTIAPAMEKGTLTTCSYASSDPEILQVDAATGAMTAISTGTATVTVTTHNGLADTLDVTVKQAPTGVAFAQDTISLARGQIIDLPLIFSSEDQGGGYTLTSGNWRVAYINDQNQLQGYGVGMVYITVTTYNGHSARLLATVWNAPSWVVLNAKQLTLGENETFALKATLPNASSSAITYTSDNESVARVDANGVITAMSRGSATITASTFNGKTARCTVRVMGAPTHVAFPEDEISLGVGQSASLQAGLSPDSIGTITYSGGEGILEINAETGAVKAIAAGSATVTATTHNGLADTCTVNVKPAPTGVAFAQDTISLARGEAIDLPEVILSADGGDCAGDYTLSTGNWRVAYINDDGKLQGYGMGMVYVTVTTYNGHSARLLATVWNAPSWIVLNTNEENLGVGDSFTLKPTLPNYCGGAITFESDNESVARVDASGVVTTVGAGTATITATTFNGKTARCIVNARTAPESVGLSEDHLLLGAGEKHSLSPVFIEGQGGSCTFESADAAIATVDANGVVTAKAAGETTITVTTFNGKSAACTVTVGAAPTALLLQESAVAISVGDTYRIAPPTLMGEDAVCSSYTFASTKPWVASVDADGLVTAKYPGVTMIGMATYNNKYDTFNLWVQPEPQSISFAETPAPMLVDETFTPVVNFSNKCTGNYTLASSDAAVAAITADGRSILAVGSGECTITATSYNGKTAEMTLRVLPLPDSVTLAPEEVTLGAGDSLQLTAQMPQGQGSLLRYTSSDEAIATANADGLLTAHAEGSATITVHTKNGKTDTCTVTVLRAPSRITLSPRSALRSIDEGGIQLSMAFGADEEGGRFSYASSDTAIATVDTNGYVTFIAEGKVTITATSYNGRQGRCDLEIGKAPSAMTFAQEAYSIALGDCIRIPVSFEDGCESYSLISSDEEIIAASGEWVTARKEGSVTLTAVSRSGLRAECSLNVVPAPTGLTLNKDSLDLIMTVGKSAVLTATAQPDGVGSATFTSSNPDVAAVDYVTGEVRAVGLGSCTITATTYDGAHSAQCSVTVRNLLEGVKIGIDPGHQLYANYETEAKSPYGGGSKIKVSAGTHGAYTGVKEHEVNLVVGLKLRDTLESLGAEVYMTRETADVNISNKERALMMNALNVDLVLRLHCNGADASSAHGISAHVRKTGYDAYNCALVGFNVLAHMLAKTGAYNRGLSYTDDFTGLNWSTVPSVLVEMGFMTNRTEDWLLINPDYQQLLIEGMINGICAYLNLDLAYPYE